ncbi:SulP family inorganic anion transporter [Magnetofaba australis]|uniref:Putative sulfate transporter/antisigma-factor antagonist n=1 Tax=Magnetofaba australis IT-1 TaxID=1434232 RepID=A0A1Y2K5E9_9PROT|nr:SulP family inorganic anion transporter [Magnetofaba australis]OSM02225.1 putative sulfate transporter/antisigma-factor antagonist [Magnetofaba australis IT-1]
MGGGISWSQSWSARHWKGDLYGGVTAAVVALPLSLAFGVASGAGASAGLYSAIIIGFFAAFLGGTPTQVSGPTGPMTVVMAALLTQYHDAPAMAFTIVAMSGVIQILLGVGRIGRYITFIPFPVISGFMSGVGAIIILLQLAPLLGTENLGKGVLGALSGLPDLATRMQGSAAALGALSLAIMLFTPGALRRLVPPPLLALVVCAPLAAFWAVGAPVVGEIPQALPAWVWPQFQWGELPNMIQWALVLALLGSIDSLLTSLVADNFTRTQHSANRELIGQGIGNAIAGLFGAIPGAGATMRTVVNIRAGGRTPASGIVHALILLGMVLGLAPLAEHIPHAALAGILLKVGWDIIDWEYLRQVHTAPRADVVVMLTVLLLTVVADLVTAVGVGVVMVSLISAQQMSEEQLRNMNLVASDADYSPIPEAGRDILRQANGKILLLHLSGPFSFGSAKEMVRRLGGIGSEPKVVALDMDDATMIDGSIAMALKQMIRQCRDNGQHVIFICGGDCARNQLAQTLEQWGVMEMIPLHNRHPIRMQGLRHALQLAQEESV